MARGDVSKLLQRLSVLGILATVKNKRADTRVFVSKARDSFTEHSSLWCSNLEFKDKFDDIPPLVFKCQYDGNDLNQSIVCDCLEPAMCHKP